MILQLIFFLYCLVSAGQNIDHSITPALLDSWRMSLQSGDINALKKLISDNADLKESPIYEGYRYASLLFAVGNGHTSLVDLFIKKFHLRLDSNDNRAIRLACTKGNTEIV